MVQFIVSVPGRTEVAGNHQDHQGGQVIAAAIDNRIECVASSRDDALICVRSSESPSFQLDLEQPGFAEPRCDERDTTQALVRGMAAQIMAAGMSMRGCTLEFTSDVPVGMGLSSSAAFELCAGAALAAVASQSNLEQSNAFCPTKLAHMAMHAEREYFGKPSGLMDQLACALGGVIRVDFRDPDEPAVTPLTLPASWDDYASFLIACESGHEDATSEYAQVAQDMQQIAELLDVAQLRDVTVSEYLTRFKEVRAQLGDRAALRGFHFYNEFDLVSRRTRALQADDMQEFVRLTELSGVSSAEYLQNVGVSNSDQPAMIALAFCRMALDEAALESGGSRGSVRIHGGGFGGTIQVFAPRSHADFFQKRIEQLMGAKCCVPITLGAPGIVVTEQ